MGVTLAIPGWAFIVNEGGWEAGLNIYEDAESSQGSMRKSYVEREKRFPGQPLWVPPREERHRAGRRGQDEAEPQTGSLSQQESGKNFRGICTQMIANRVKLQIQAWRQMLRRRARRGRTRSVAMSVSGDDGARCWRCRKLPARVAEQQRGGRGQLEVAGLADEVVEMESGGKRSELPQSRGM